MKTGAPTLPNGSTRARAANDKIADRAQQLHFAARVPFRCECDDAACDTLIMISLDGYHQLRTSGSLPTAPHHHVNNANIERQSTDYWVQHRPKPL